MTKSSGLGDNLYLAGYNISNDTGGVSRVGGGLAGTQDVTGIDKEAHERVGLGRDGSIEYSGFLNPAVGYTHDAHKSLPRTDVDLMYCRGTTLGNACAMMTGKQVNYDFSRAADGSLTTAVQAQANGYGLSWGVLLTAGQRTDAGATSGTSVDQLAATTFGLSAQLQVFSITGTSVTVAIEHSSDNGVGDPWAAVCTFAAKTARGTEFKVIATGTTVKRYVRATTSGTFNPATFAVGMFRHPETIYY